MKLFQPQISLFRRMENSVVSDYLIHAVTFMDNGKYFSLDDSPQQIEINSEGQIEITFTISLDEDLDISVLNPIVHKLSFDEFMPNASNPFIEVVVKEGERSVGKGVVHMDEADEVEKPVPKSVL